MIFSFLIGYDGLKAAYEWKELFFNLVGLITVK